MNLNIIILVIALFFAIGWSYLLFVVAANQPQHRHHFTHTNVNTVILWWCSIGSIFLFNLPSFHLLYIMPAMVLVSLLTLKYFIHFRIGAGLIVLAIIIGLIK